MAHIYIQYWLFVLLAVGTGTWRLSPGWEVCQTRNVFADDKLHPTVVGASLSGSVLLSDRLYSPSEKLLTDRLAVINLLPSVFYF